MQRTLVGFRRWSAIWVPIALSLLLVAVVAGCGSDAGSGAGSGADSNAAGGAPGATRVPLRASGLSPVSIAIDGPTVWVADPGAGRVVGVDRASLQVVGTVPLDGFPAVVAAGESGVWAAELLANRVVLLDPATRAVQRQWFTVGDFPDALAVDDSGVWVTNYAGKSLARIDADAPDGIDTPSVIVPLDFRPAGIALTPDVVWLTDTVGDVVERRDTDGSLVGRIKVSGGPERLVATETSVWVTARLEGRLDRVDVRSGEVTGSVDLGFRPTALAAGPGPDGELVWVANGQGGEVVAVDPVDLNVVRRYPTGGGPMALDVADGLLWVAQAEDASVGVIDVVSGARQQVALPAEPPEGSGAAGPGSDQGWAAPLARVPRPVLQRSTATTQAISLDSQVFYLAASGDDLWLTLSDPEAGTGSVVRVDTISGSVTGRWPLPGSAGGLAVTDTRVWVAAFEANEVWAIGIDAPDGEVAARIPVGVAPLGVIEAFGSVWVAVRGDGQVARIDPRSAQVVAVHEVGAGVANVAASASQLWLTLPDDGLVAEMDPGTGVVTRRIPVGNTPVGIAAGGDRVWVTTRDDGVVSAIDTRSGDVVARTLVGNRPRGVVALTGPGDSGPVTQVLVAVSGDGVVAAVDPVTGALVRLFAVGTFPMNLVAGSPSQGSPVWVADLDGMSVIALAVGR